MTQAFVNHGRWIADCERRDCHSAEALEIMQLEMICTECGLQQQVSWPLDALVIDAVLAVRPVHGTRNWAPRGHRQAVACHVEDGQTIDDLIVENMEHLT